MELVKKCMKFGFHQIAKYMSDEQKKAAVHMHGGSVFCSYIADATRRSISSAYVIPVCIISFGYILMLVNPGRVLISLNTMFP